MFMKNVIIEKAHSVAGSKRGVGGVISDSDGLWNTSYLFGF